jgi:ABC-type multidrug transport system ATPase subunit
MLLTGLTGAPRKTPLLFPGERVAVLGPGADTMLDRLARVTPEACHLSGRFPWLDDEATGWDNLHRALGHGAEARAASAFCGLDGRLDLPVKYYTDGMRYRLGFTLATARQPRILLASPGMLGGDLAFRQRARRRLERLALGADVAALACGEPAWLAQLCTRCVWVEGNAIRRDGPVAEVLAEMAVSRRAA